MYERERPVFCHRAATADCWAIHPLPQGTKREENSHPEYVFSFFLFPEIIKVQRGHEMRHAVAPPENVENNSFAVTNLLKICTHCERLNKKVRERKRLQTQIKLTHNAPFEKLLSDVGSFYKCHIIDVFVTFFFSTVSKQAALQSFVQACLRGRPVGALRGKTLSLGLILCAYLS